MIELYNHGKAVNTVKQNKRSLSASFRIGKKHIQTSLPPFSILRYAPWKLSRGYKNGKERRDQKLSKLEIENSRAELNSHISENSSTAFAYYCRLSLTSFVKVNIEIKIR